jgi:hypothetical protein
MGEMIRDAKEAPPKRGRMSNSKRRRLFWFWKRAADSLDMNKPMILEPSSGGTGMRLKTDREILITTRRMIRLRIAGGRGRKCNINERAIAKRRLLTGPARAIKAVSRRGSRRLKGS